MSTTDVMTAVGPTPPLAAPAAAGAAAFLVYIYPKSPLIGRCYPLGGAAVHVGRGHECAVWNPDPSVSRRHARVDRTAAGVFVVTDLGSTNGTFVNGVRTAAGVLTDGDVVHVGNCVYRFVAGTNVEALYHEELYRLSVYDPLTGVHNRRYLLTWLDREVARAARRRRPLAVALIDVDHFKAVNDKYGHLAGDLTLKKVAGCLAAQVRADELLARYGGEEFAAVLTETDRAGAREFGERVRAAVAALPLDFNGRAYHVTVSVGVGGLGAGERLPPDDLLARADANLYDAKRSGRNAVRG